jgi:hypothetical protein
VNRRRREQIDKLLAKADSTTFPHEREALLRKVSELRVKYGATEDAWRRDRYDDDAELYEDFEFGDFVRRYRMSRDLDLHMGTVTPSSHGLFVRMTAFGPVYFNASDVLVGLPT